MINKQSELLIIDITMKKEITLKINGEEFTEQVEPRTLLVHFIRENIGMTGTHIGCDISSCACTT